MGDLQKIWDSDTGMGPATIADSLALRRKRGVLGRAAARVLGNRAHLKGSVTLHRALTAGMAVVHQSKSEWLSKHDKKPPAAQSSEDSTVITTEHNAATSAKSRKRKAAEALLNKMHLAANSGAQKKKRQEAVVVSYWC